MHATPARVQSKYDLFTCSPPDARINICSSDVGSIYYNYASHFGVFHNRERGLKRRFQMTIEEKYVFFPLKHSSLLVNLSQ